MTSSTQGKKDLILIKGLPSNSTTQLVAWWYGGLRKNHLDPSEPVVEVCFRPLDRLDDKTDDTYEFYDVGLTHLGQVRLGSVWQGQRRVGDIALDNATFHLDFSDSGWCIGGSWDLYEASDTHRLIPPFIHLLRDKERLLRKPRVVQFHSTECRSALIIPCLEVFSRLYGRSQYVKRVLATQPFAFAYDELILPDVEPAPDGVWQVTVDKHCVNDDAVFLSHLKYDDVTKRRVRNIWGQSEAAQKVVGESPVFLEVGPWFSGMAQLRLRGKWINKEKTRFLALRIDGESDPGGVDVYLDRSNTSLTGPLPGSKGGKSWPIIKSEPSKGGKDIVLTHLLGPSSAHETQEVEDEPMTKLGKRRKVQRVTRESTAVRSKPLQLDVPPTNLLSGGKVHGGPQGVGLASIAAPTIGDVDHETHGYWATLLEMANDLSSPIQDVAAVTSSGTLRWDGPCLISLPDPTNPESGLDEDARSWVFLDHTTRAHIRGVALFAIGTLGGKGYLLEVQKRPPETASGDRQSRGAFQGLAFTIHKGGVITPEQIQALVVAIANAKGVVKNVRHVIPGSFGTYTHLNPSRGGLNKSILNGLGEIGLA